MKTVFLTLVLTLTLAHGASAQTPTPAQQAEAEKAFDTANTLMEQGKHAEALTEYKKVLAVMPDEPSALFNAGMAAYYTKDFNLALDLWKRLKKVEPEDWHVRSKLIQAYQALGKPSERNTERSELFEMWKSGKPAELKEKVEYCREQFEINGKSVMAFEHFELKGPRGLRYVFSILNEAGDGEEFRISMGSYDFTNNVWRETRNPKPKEGERLFHLDGYFKNGAHATYGMYFPEPTYDDIRAIVVKILEGKGQPISSTTPGQAKPSEKPKP